MLSVLSDAQLKRISLALFEIGKELEAMGIKTTDDTDDEGDAVVGSGEEVLEAEEEGEEADAEGQQDIHGPHEVYGGQRKRVDSKSESGHSTGSSSVFPYHVSPTTSSFATVPQTYEPHDASTGGTTGAAAAPTLGRIPASPKILDLHAHVSPPPSFDPLPPATSTPGPSTADAPATSKPVEALSPFKQTVIIQEGTRPKPILTPTRTLPVKHNPSDSFDGSTPVTAIAIPGYVPGQLRPVGSIRSDSSSRSGTPVGSTASIVSQSQDHTLTPASRVLALPLARSQSVQAGQTRQTPTSQQNQHQRNASLGYVTDSWRSASPLAQMSRSSAADIEEEDDDELVTGNGSSGSKLPSASASGDASPRAPSDEEDIRVRQVIGKHSVARSRSDAKQRRQLGKAAGSASGTDTASGGVSASPSLLDVPEASRPKYASHQSHQAAIEGGSDCSYAASSQARGPSAMSHTSDTSRAHEADQERQQGHAAKRASIDSTGSCYKGFLGLSVGAEDMMEDDYLQTPEVDVHELEAILGISKATLAALQDKLVARAKAEREAFRAEMGDSPALIVRSKIPWPDMCSL
jgi:hypothetical protein